jgi:hypothetical protein
MVQSRPRYTTVIQQEVARLLMHGSHGRLGALQLARQDDLDMVVSIPQAGPSVIGLRIETTSRLTMGPFGTWLVIDATAPAARFRRDPRASYLFGHFSLPDMTFVGPMFVVPSNLVEVRPGLKGRSPRLSFRARLDAVNQEWSEFAVAPDHVGAHMLALLRDMPQYGQQAA